MRGYNGIYVIQKNNRVLQKYPMGFSWAIFFFGPIVFLFYSHYISALVAIGIYTVLGIILPDNARGAFLLMNIILAFKYCNVYTALMIPNGSMIVKTDFIKPDFMQKYYKLKKEIASLRGADFRFGASSKLFAEGQIDPVSDIKFDSKSKKNSYIGIGVFILGILLLSSVLSYTNFKTAIQNSIEQTLEEDFDGFQISVRKVIIPIGAIFTGKHDFVVLIDSETNSGSVVTISTDWYLTHTSNPLKFILFEEEFYFEISDESWIKLLSETGLLEQQLEQNIQESIMNMFN